MQQRKMTLPSGDTLHYRIPNVVEQLRFFVDSKWYDEPNYWQKISNGLEFAREFVIKVDGAAQCIEDAMNDRQNFDCICDFVLDIAGIVKKKKAAETVAEDEAEGEKKP